MDGNELPEAAQRHQGGVNMGATFGGESFIGRRNESQERGWEGAGQREAKKGHKRMTISNRIRLILALPAGFLRLNSSFAPFSP